MAAAAEGDSVDNGCGCADGSWLGFGGEEAESERGLAERPGAVRPGAVRPGEGRSINYGNFAKKTLY